MTRRIVFESILCGFLGLGLVGLIQVFSRLAAKPSPGNCTDRGTNPLPLAATYLRTQQGTDRGPDDGSGSLFLLTFNSGGEQKNGENA